MKSKKIFICILATIIFTLTLSVQATTSFDVEIKSMKVYDNLDLSEIITTDSDNLEYTSSNENIAIVSDDGIVTTLAMGELVITVSDGTTSDTCTFSSGYYVGIDVSKWNGTVDWEKVKNYGIDFAMIRASYGWYDDTDAQNGKDYDFQYDTEFLTNIKNAGENGVSFGIYHYAYATTTDEAELEAEYVLNAIDVYGAEYKEYMTLPIAYDVEDSKLSSLTKKELTDVVIAFCTKIYDAGYTPIIYANRNYFVNYLDLEKLNALAYNFWYAYWTSSPDYTDKITIGDTDISPVIWQYSETGSVDGANTSSGYVDLDIMYMKDRVKIEVKVDNEVVYITGADKGYALETYPEIEKDGYTLLYFTDDDGVIIDDEYIFNSDTQINAIFQLNISKGDMNKDGKINAEDAAIVLDRYKNNDASDEDYAIGDMNEDGRLNAEDAAMILDVYKNG